MSTQKQTVEDILGRLAPLQVRARSMFGEYGLYCDEKIVALVCDDRLFLKPTAASIAVDSELEACPPYPGARDYWLLDERVMDRAEHLRRLVQATADELPVTKPKRKRKPKST